MSEAVIAGRVQGSLVVPGCHYLWVVVSRTAAYELSCALVVLRHVLRYWSHLSSCQVQAVLLGGL